MSRLIGILLTSHRMDCLELNLWCLERFTDMKRFAAFYVIGNDLTPEHRALAQEFAVRHPCVKLTNCKPRGLGTVMAVLEAILREHPEDVIIKLDEDVFVTRYWLDVLLTSFRKTRKDGCLLGSAFVPNNQIGRQCIHSIFLEHFPEEYTQQTGKGNITVHESPAYAIWLWKKILEHDETMTRCLHEVKSCAPYTITGYLNINCIVFDTYLTEMILASGLTNGLHDEYVINYVLGKKGHFGLMFPRSLVHHYSFRMQQAALDQEIGMDAVARHFRQLYA